MTIPVNRITIDVFQHETEDQSKILIGLKSLFPDDYHEMLEKIFKVDEIIGHHKNQILKYYSEFPKNKETQNLFFFIIQKVLQSISFFDLFDRISESGELYLRLNKQDLIQYGQFTLDGSPDVYKVVIKFLFFNKKVNKIKEIYDFLQSIPLV